MTPNWHLMIHDPNDEATNDPMTRKPQVVTQLCLIIRRSCGRVLFRGLLLYGLVCISFDGALVEGGQPPSEGMPDRAGDGEQRRKLRWVVAPRFTTLYPGVRFGGNGG